MTQDYFIIAADVFMIALDPFLLGPFVISVYDGVKALNL